MPTKIVYGVDSFKTIDQYINGRKTLLMTSKGFIKRGLVDKIKSYTSDIVKVISEVKSHPEFKDLAVIYQQTKRLDFELILALGGGSVIDSAKFIAVHNKNRDYQFVENLTKGKIAKKDYKITPIIAVPTTAGTGSEITPYATIWDMDEKLKYSLNLTNLFSEITIYDPKLTVSLPKNLTIQTGLDSLSHALESIWNKNANTITTNYAIMSAKLVMANLVPLTGDLKNLAYRDNMMRGCLYAALAFSNTQTAIAHAISYYVTAYKNVPHGVACSFTLPMFIDNVVGKYDFIDKALIEIFGELSSQKLRNMLKALEISTEFSNYGISDIELENIKLSLINNLRADNSLVNLS